MGDELQSAVAARLPGAAALGLVPPPGAVVVQATVFADAAWVAERLRALGVRYGTRDCAVSAALWWYSASAVLVGPALAGLLTRRPLSARLADTSVWLLSGELPIAATSWARGGDVAAELRQALAAAVGAVVAAGGVRPRPLWAIATDSLAGRALALGRAAGDVPAATALAGRLAARAGAPLLPPRFVDVAGTRFVHRVSCCLIYRAPDQPMCTSCPRRPAAQRAALLEDLA